MAEPRRMEISKDKSKVTYSIDFIKELIAYLHSLNTYESKTFAFKLAVDESKIPKMNEKEIYLRSLTSAERKAMLYASSVPKDSDTLKILRMLEAETNSDNT